MNLSQIKVLANALSLSFFNSEQTGGNVISSCLSHRAASGEVEERRGPNWYVAGKMLLPPSQTRMVVMPASANAQASRQLCSSFLSSGHSPRCCVYLIDSSHCQKSHFSRSLTVLLDLRLVVCWCPGLTPRAALAWPPWSSHAVCWRHGKGLCGRGEVTPLPSHSPGALVLSLPEEPLESKRLPAEFYF